MDFGLLGPLVVRDGPREISVSAPRQRVLLAGLLLSAGRVVSLDALAGMLWEGEPPAGARGALHSAVQRLRSTLGPAGAELIETRAPGYLIGIGDDKLDIRQFSALTTRGHAAAEAGDWAQAASLLREALGLWRGDPLADVPSPVLRDREVASLEDQRQQAVAARIDADLHLGRHSEVVAELRQLVAAHPLQEQFHARLMLSLYRSGRQADALAAYQDARRIVTGELGLEPSPELRLLHQRILAADAELQPGADGVQPGALPGVQPGAPGALPGLQPGVQPGAQPGIQPGAPGALPGVPGASPGSAAGTRPVAPGSAAPGSAAPGSAAPGIAAPGIAAPGIAAPSTAAPGPHDPVTGRHVVPRQLPAATRLFAGRDGALMALAGLAAEAAGTSQATVIAVIDGPAGIGKTTLAVHFAQQAAGRFPDGQLYLNLRGFDPAAPPMTPAEAIRLFLDALDVPAAQIPASLDAQTALYRSLLAGQRALVLLDNARDADQVRPLLPASPGCLVIVTSRSQLTSLVATEGAFPLALDVLSGADAHELLTRRLGPERVAGDPGAVDELIQLCARLPLALSIAAARSASQPALPIAALTADLRDARKRLDVLDAGHPSANVRAVLSWSYEQLGPGTARLFRLLGLHPGPDFSAPAAASLAGLPLDEGRRRLGELASVRLLTEHAPGRFSSHDLLRAYAAELALSADSEAERNAATGRMLDHYLNTAYPAAMLLHPTRRPVTLPPLQPGAEPEHIGDSRQALAWFQTERPVLLAAAGRALEAGFDIHVWQIAQAMSEFLDTRGRWHDWVGVEEQALVATQRLGDRAAEATVRQRLGYARARLGAYDSAYAHLELALGIHTERGDQGGAAYARNAIAITLHSQGRHGEALDQAEQSLKLYTAVGDPSGQSLALNLVGWFHALLGDSQQALSHGARALDLFRETGNRDGEASALDTVGYAHQQLGNHAAATAFYRQAIELDREIGSRPGLAETLDHLGDTRLDAGDQAEARTAWEEALAILDDLRHPGADAIRAKLEDLGTAVSR